MTRKSLAKPKLTDAKRHNRFVAMAQQVGASDGVKDFEKALEVVPLCGTEWRFG
jgi:hypothetical protein